MLNYIWTALLAAGLGFGLWHDARDLLTDRYRNDAPLTFAIQAADAEASRLTLTLSAAAYAAHFDDASDVSGDLEAEARFDPGDADTDASVTFDAGTALPPRLATIAAETHADGLLLGTVVARDDTTLTLSFPPVRFLKMRAISAAAIDYAEIAVTIALGLIGGIALWLGIVKIAEDAGLVRVFVRLIRPLLGFLFPSIPRDHPALGMIALNFAANMLGLGNAAPPMGLKAMEELQTLNPDPEKETATDAMCMFLAMNTASVVLVPPATLIAIMGLAAVDVFLPIFLVTLVSLSIAIGSCALLGVLWRSIEARRMPTEGAGGPP